MIHITNHTTQQEIVDLLLSELSQQGNLYLEIISLPYFLASVPSIKVFQYKIQKYPRLIFWSSYNTEILDLLQQSSLLVDFPPTLTHCVEKPRATIINIRSNSINDDVLIDTDTTQGNSGKKKRDQEIQTVNSSLLSGNVYHNSEFNPLQFTKPIDFNSNSMLDEFRKKHLKQDSKASIKQDLDQWLQKIESTKNALSKFQNEAEENKIQASENNSFLYNLRSTFANPFVYRSLISCTLVAFVFGCWFFYPTNRYKLDVVTSTHQEAINTSIPESVFKKTTVELKTTASVESSGQKNSSRTSRATGKVTLVNNSNSSVDFNKDGIILLSESNGLEYSHKSLTSDPKVFTVPAKNIANSQSIEINVQAVDFGEKFNLPTNSIFRVYNLKGEAMGSAFKAVASVDITTIDSSGEKIFTEDDMSLLRTKLEQGFLEEKNKQIQDLKDSNLLTNSAWTSLAQPTYDFSAIIGSNVKTVSAQAQSSMQIFSLPKSTLTEKVQEQMFNKQISDITIVDSKIVDSNFVTKLFVNCTDNPEIIKHEIQNKFESSDFSGVTADLQLTYPNVKRVSKDFSGVNLPMVSPRNKIEINQVGQK